MANDFRQFDEHGFPVPPSYADLKYHDEGEAKRVPRISTRTKRVVVIGLSLAFLLIVVLGPQIKSAGSQMIAEWFVSSAQRKIVGRDYRGAVADLGRAIGWNPTDWQLFLTRAELQEHLRELTGALSDVTKSIELLDLDGDRKVRRQRALDRPSILAIVYSKRSMIHVRLGHARQAIDDASQAIRFRPDPIMLNGRAYVRALVNTELSEGLADVDKALAKSGPDQAEYLDTRGYLLHLLGRNEDALKDLDRAIQLEERSNEQVQSLAVMYHHRGLIYEKLDRKEDADRDLQRGNQLGYNPAAGVF